jgi:hypothetical protein
MRIVRNLALGRPMAALLLAGSLTALGGCSDDPLPSEGSIPTGNGVCLQTSLIDRTEVPDDNTILFHMKDGKVWKNTLAFACSGLKFEGSFAYTTETPRVCSSQQTIRVLRTGNFCELGQFTPYSPAS